ncbi:MAG: hypothetical protein HYZ49_07210 [Chloroflexi bacterium]|nr:hypothetical protein [Chloroflexota bacterium]
MKPIRFFAILLVLAVLLLPATHLALAWPDQPPDAAFISGPGIAGQIEITDKAVLRVLRLGGVEDFAGGPVAEPAAGNYYTITRYFYDGEFNFGVLTYAATPAGSYIRFDDGPDLSGNHTEFNGKWFRVTNEGETAIQNLLQTMGVSPVAPSAAVEIGPAASANTTALSPSQPLIWVAVLVGVLALSGGILALARLYPIEKAK